MGSAAGGLLFNVAALLGVSFVLTVFQVGAVGFLAGRICEIYQIGAGFGLTGIGIALLATARTTFFVFVFVTLLALGMAFVAPNLAALILKRSVNNRALRSAFRMPSTVSVRQVDRCWGGALFENNAH